MVLDKKISRTIFGRYVVDGEGFEPSKASPADLQSVVLVLVSAALPAYSQSFFINIGISEALAPTLANVLNILVQVVLSYPTMKFWIMPNK